jgi:phosphoadenosine phosphosulfate reductase
MILEQKIQKSINTIKCAESLALKYRDYGFHLAFSGGKDSQCIYELCKMANVKFKSFMSVTTLDHPELMKFVRKNYPDVIMERPRLNFYKLIEKYKQLPLRMVRYCCHDLKEQSGAGSVVIIGIRKAESSRRNKRNELEISGHKYSNSLDQFNIDNESQILCAKGKDKILLSPILDWTDRDVWDFIKLRKLEYCKLYDEGYKRIGCIFCPMSTVKDKIRDRRRYAGIERAIKKSLQKIINEVDYPRGYKMAVDDIFNWWMSNDNIKSFHEKKKQTSLF